MRFFVVLALLALLCTGCSTFQDASKTLSDTRDLLDRFEDVTDDIIPAVDETIQAGSEIISEAEKLSELDVELLEVLGPALEELKGAKEELSEVKQQAFEQADKDEDGNLDWLERIIYLVLLGGGGLGLAGGKIKNITGRIEHERRKRKELETRVRNGHGT